MNLMTTVFRAFLVYSPDMPPFSDTPYDDWVLGSEANDVIHEAQEMTWFTVAPAVMRSTAAMATTQPTTQGLARIMMSSVKAKRSSSPRKMRVGMC